MPLSILQSTGQLSTRKNYLAQKVSSAEILVQSDFVLLDLIDLISERQQ